MQTAVGQLPQVGGGFLEPAVLAQALHQVFAQLLHLIVGLRLRQQRARLQVDQPRADDDELGQRVGVDLLA